jgi:ribosomal protein S27AE
MIATDYPSTDIVTDEKCPECEGATVETNPPSKVYCGTCDAYIDIKTKEVFRRKKVFCHNCGVMMNGARTECPSCGVQKPYRD